MTAPTRPGDALSDTQRRFLAAVMERLPREFIHEIYLFAPMKQRSVETGIAVVAIGEALVLDAEATDADGVAGELAAEEHPEVARLEPRQVDADSTDDGSTDDGSTDDEHLEGAEQPAKQAALPEDADDSVVSPALERPLRYTIHTARYRLQLKGPERGKWDVDVVEEADAPLVTVDAVVRGVHRRSGEPSEVERLAPHDLARALGEIPWTSEN